MRPTSRPLLRRQTAGGVVVVRPPSAQRGGRIMMMPPAPDVLATTSTRAPPNHADGPLANDDPDVGEGESIPQADEPYMIGRVSCAPASAKEKAAPPAMGKISVDHSCKYGAADLADCCQGIRDLLPIHKGGNTNPPWIRFGALESDRDRDDNRCQPYCAVTHTAKSMVTQPCVIKINKILHGILRKVPTMQ